MWCFFEKELRNDFIVGIILGLVLCFFVYYFDASANIVKNLELFIYVNIIDLMLHAISLVAYIKFPERRKRVFPRLNPTFSYMPCTLYFAIFVYVYLAVFNLLLVLDIVPRVLVYLLIVMNVLELLFLYRCSQLFVKIVMF